MTPRWSRMHKLLAATIVVAAGLSVAGVTPALADGWRGHERHEWREHEWREHHAWHYYHPYYHPYGYGYYGYGGYAYPGYYYAPPPVYEPPSITFVVPFR